MNSKLYVGNMSFKTTEADLRAAFGQFGSVTDVYIANDRETGRPRGFAFVEMATPEAARKAIETLDGTDLDGRTLRVNEAQDRPRGPRPGGGGMRPGGGGGLRSGGGGGGGGGRW